MMGLGQVVTSKLDSPVDGWQTDFLTSLFSTCPREELAATLVDYFKECLSVHVYSGDALLGKCFPDYKIPPRFLKAFADVGATGEEG